MGLLSFLKRKIVPAAEAPAAAAPDAVAAARTRARRRLIGAAVLLGIGVIGFPLLFETQPRPIPVNIPIEIPGKEGAAPLALPAAVPALTPAPAAVVSGAEPAKSSAAAEIVEKADEQIKAPAPAAKPDLAAAQPDAAPKPEAQAAKPAATPAATPKPAPAPEPAPVKSADDGARARALLSGQAGAEASTRVVVQVGAYTEAAKLRDARQKVEKLGFKTYTQVVESGGVKQTRVRVGPFDNRAEADKAAARIRASGLAAAVYTL